MKRILLTTASIILASKFLDFRKKQKKEKQNTILLEEIRDEIALKENERFIRVGKKKFSKLTPVVIFPLMMLFAAMMFKYVDLMIANPSTYATIALIFSTVGYLASCILYSMRSGSSNLTFTLNPTYYEVVK